MVQDNNDQGQDLSVESVLESDRRNPQMLIGVSGALASGKTVFLTSVFQTIFLHSSNEKNIVTFDRKQKGGAAYFEKIEREIRETGSTAGTRGIKTARLLFKPEKALSWYKKNPFPVNLYDFSGGYFSRISDIKHYQTSELSEEEKNFTTQVNEYLETCDGLIILIDSKHFNNVETPSEDIPIPPSIRFLVEECYARKRPLALVFTQSDMNPSVTLEQIKNIPFVKRMVLNRFTSDHKEAGKGAKPFGIVELITCYKLDETTKKPKVLDKAQNIWTDDAGRIFMEIMRAGVPKFKERYVEAQRMIEFDRKVKLRKQKEERAEQRKKTRNIILGAAAAVSLILMGIFAYYYFSKRGNDDFLDRLSAKINQGEIYSISDSELKKLGEIIRGKGFVSKDKKKEFCDLFRQKMEEKLNAEPVLSREYFDTIKKCNIPLNAMSGNEDFQKYKPLLDKRLTLLDWWQKAEDEFTKESTAQGRLRKIYQFLDKDEYVNDKEYSLVTREYFARKAAASVLELEENKRSLDILEKADPRVKDYQGAHLQYKIIYLQFEKVADNLQTYASIYATMKDSLQKLENQAKSRSALMESVLTKIYRGLSAKNQKRIAYALTDSIKESYMFELAPDQRITGLDFSVETLVSELKKCNRNCRRVLASFFKKPVYLTELETILALLAKRYYQYTAISCVKGIFQTMNYGYSVDIRLLENLEQKIEELTPPDKSYLEETLKYFRFEKRNLNWAKSLVEKWNKLRGYSHYQAYQGSIDKVKSKIEKFLRDLCKRTENPGEGDCADVDEEIRM